MFQLTSFIAKGFTKLTRADFETAQMLNYRIKLLAIGKKTGNRTRCASTRP
ncbi:MAG: hypothetical protein R2881_00435 [Eubacteriales bacterium]